MFKQARIHILSWLFLALFMKCGYADTLGDPTRPPEFSSHAEEAEQASVTQWKLQSILIAPERRLAVVNGATVTVGRHVDGARVTRIGTDSVDLSNNGEHFTLRLIQGISKVPANSKASR